MIVEHHRDAGIRTQPLATGARGEIHTFEIHRHRPDAADAIKAKLHSTFGAELLQLFEVVRDTRGSFAMRTPYPFRRGVRCEPGAQ